MYSFHHYNYLKILIVNFKQLRINILIPPDQLLIKIINLRDLTFIVPKPLAVTLESKSEIKFL